MENSIIMKNKKSNFLSKFKQNDRLNVIIKMICLTSTFMSYLNKGLFVACFVYLILPQKILYLTTDITNLIFFQ